MSPKSRKAGWAIEIFILISLIWCNGAGAADTGVLIEFTYDALGNRISKTVIPPGQLLNRYPSEPILKIPGNNANGVDSTKLVLAWEGQDPDPRDRLTFDVYLGDTNPPPLYTNTGGTSLTVGPLKSEQTYFWKVVARDTQDAETASDVHRFTTLNNPPYTPELDTLAPSDDNIIVVRKVNLKWRGNGDPNPGDTVASYDVYFGTEPNPPIQAGGIADTHFAIEDLDPAQTYYWRIVARDNKGAMNTDSPIWRFTTQENIPPILDDVVFSDDTLLPRGGGPYIVTGSSMTVETGVNLYVESGTVFKFDAGTRLEVNGSLSAIGSESSRIIFTSILDDTYGGDTNGDGEASMPAAGDWHGIEVLIDDSNGNLTVEHCLIEYAANGLTVQTDSHSANVIIKNSTIRISSGNGLSVYGTKEAVIDLEIDGNRLEENGGHGLFVSVTGNLTGISGSITANTISENGTYGIYVHTGEYAHSSLNIIDNIISGHVQANLFLETLVWGPVYISQASHFVGSNRIYDSKFGILSTVRRAVNTLEITSNDIFNCEDGVSVESRYFAQVTALIKDNRIYNNTGRGLAGRLFEKYAALTVDVFANHIHHNGGKGIEFTYDEQRLDLYHDYPNKIRPSIALNNIHDNGDYGIYLHTTDPASVVLNTVNSNKGGIHVGNIEKSETDQDESKIHYNNILENNTTDGSDNVYELANGDTTSVNARFNHWGHTVAAYLNSGSHPHNIAIVHDIEDQDVGRVYYENWLENRALLPSIPVSKIINPLNETVQKTRCMTIRGIAAAPDGISAVNVSTDGGETWHLAAGTETWKFDWCAQNDGRHQIIAKATDRIGIIEIIGADTNVTIDSTLSVLTTTGIINGDETWSGEIRLTGDVTVPADATLTILPGTTVRFQAEYDDLGIGSSGSRSELIIHGQLHADGVVFTSDAVSPKTGDWSGIHFVPLSPEASLTLHNCTVEYGINGVTSRTEAHPVSVTITDTTIRQNLEHGIDLMGSGGKVISLILDRSRLLENGKSGYYTVLKGANTYLTGRITGNDISGNQENGIIIETEYDNEEQTEVGFDLTINQNIVSENQNYGIYVKSHNEKFAYAGQRLIVNENEIWANATSIKFDALYGTYITEFKNNTIYSNTQGLHVFAGESAIVLAKIEENEIHNNSNRGIYCYSSAYAINELSVQIHRNRVYQNGSYGIQCSRRDIYNQGTIEPVLTLNRIYENGDYGIHCVADRPALMKYNSIYANLYGVYLKAPQDTIVEYNDILAVNDTYAFEYHGTADISARHNRWNESATAQMTTGADPDITAIHDHHDNADVGRVDYALWLTESIDTLDTDADSLSDRDEYALGTDPGNPDSDGDGSDDADEYAYWGDGWNADPDGDNLINMLDPDADNDGLLDSIEITQGSDPADANSIGPPPVVYEDAEDGTISGWRVYDGDPLSADIENIFDSDRQSRVVQLTGESTIHGFMLTKDDGTLWNNASQSLLQFSIQCADTYIIYIDLQTTAGHRYLKYTPSDYDGLGGGEYVHQGLGWNTRNGRWHDITVDLLSDLQDAQPGADILAVNGILVRGSIRFDDIRLVSGQRDTDGDGIADSDETGIYGTDPSAVDTDGDGLADGAEIDHWKDNWGGDADGDSLINLLDADADNDGVSDGIEIERGTDPGIRLSAPATVYEDAEDGLTSGWKVYAGATGGAAIVNTFNGGKGSNVIDLSGNGLDHGYVLYKDDGSLWQNKGQFVAEWKLKYDEPFTVYIELETNAGRRYMQYTPADNDSLGFEATIHHGLGSHTVDGQWHRYMRDLQADLLEAQADTTILAINCFMIRGSGLLDDIKLWTRSPDSDQDTLSDLEELNIHGTDPQNADTDIDGISDGDEVSIYATAPTAADTDADGIDDGDELDYWKTNWHMDIDGDGMGNLIDTDSDNDSVPDGLEIARGTKPDDASEFPDTVYEDAEDGNTTGWVVYDGNPESADISNVFDAELDSRVIGLSGEGTVHGYRLGKQNGAVWDNAGQFWLELKINFSEFFIIYVDLQTTAGHCYLKYTPSDYSDMGSGEYVHYGLGGNTVNGRWHTVTRDLAQDLSTAQPAASIEAVNGILIRGSGWIDDVKLTAQ